MSDNYDTVVLYHRGCNDGLGAAWAASKVLPKETPLVQYQYGEELPTQVYNKHLILVDLSLTPEQIGSIYPDHIKSIMIIDHHKTAIDKLGHLPAIYSYADYLVTREKGGVFLLADVSRSGAVLAHAFFNNLLTTENWRQSIPLALQQLEDYDLWKFELDDTEAVNAWMINCASRVEDIDTALDDNGRFRPETIALGQTLVNYDEKIVNSVIRNYIQEGVWNGRRYALINAPHHLRNRIGDSLKHRYDFVACYTQRKNQVVFSLRSNKGNGVDLTEIAEAFGGGGHGSAAAFTVEHNTPRRLFVENPFGKPTLKQRLQLIWWALTTKRLV